jgi:hypothetical protein
LVLCGHCKMPHDSVEAVKACSQTDVSSPANGNARSKAVHISNADSEGRWLPRNSTGRGYGSQAQDLRAYRKTLWANRNPSKLMTPAELSKWLEENKFQ